MKMSLEDRFYPDDGSFINKFDNAMVKAAGKVGKVYQNFTGVSYESLVKKAYKWAARGFQINIGDIVNGGKLRKVALHYSAYPKIESPREEEIRMEVLGLPKKTWKYARALLTGPSAFLLTLSPVCIGFGLYENNYISISEGILLAYLPLSALPFAFAECLSKSDIPEPPKKTVPQKIMDKFRQIYSPQPRPQELPAPG